MPLLLLTLKTDFLIALASAFRVSELRALSVLEDCCQFHMVGSCSLLTCAGFIDKNRLPSAGAQRLLLLPLQDNVALCPVAALRQYVDRTATLRGSNLQLFVSARSPRSRTSPQLVSTSVKSTVTRAYEWEAARSLDPSAASADDVSVDPGPVSTVSSSTDQPGTSARCESTFHGEQGVRPDVNRQWSRGRSPTESEVDVRSAPDSLSPRLRLGDGSQVLTPSVPCGPHYRPRAQSQLPGTTTRLCPSQPSGQPVAGRAAHELRALAASLAFHRGTPLDEILRAVGWTSGNTFARFYLRHLPAAAVQGEVPLRLPCTN